MSKITINELASTLMAKHGLKRTEAELFIRQFVVVVNEALTNDKIAKVKGLGTFKVTSVSARKSVDVNTGEPIIIQGRDKITFTADNTMRDLVNAPFAQFETVIVNEGVDFSAIDERHKNELTEDVTETDNDEQINDNTSNDSVENCESEQQHSPDTVRQPETDITDNTEISANQDSTDSADVIENNVIADNDVIEENADITEDNPVSTETEPEDIEAPVSVSEQNTVTTHVANSDKKNDIKEASGSTDEHDSVSADLEHDRLDEDTNSCVTEKEYINHNIGTFKTWTTVLAVSLVTVLVLSLVGFIYLNSQINKRDNRIEYLEAQSAKLLERMMKVHAATPDSTVLKAKADSMKAIRDEANKIQKVSSEQEAEKNRIAEEKKAEETRKAEESRKAEDAKKAAEEKKAADARNSASEKYNSDPRVRLGAYIIIGVDKTVTVRPGQTLSGISKAHLGPGMECYVEAVNGGKKTYNAGDKINIPKLQLKKKSK